MNRQIPNISMNDKVNANDDVSEKTFMDLLDDPNDELLFDMNSDNGNTNHNSSSASEGALEIVVPTEETDDQEFFLPESFCKTVMKTEDTRSSLPGSPIKQEQIATSSDALSPSQNVSPKTANSGSDASNPPVQTDEDQELNQKNGRDKPYSRIYKKYTPDDLELAVSMVGKGDITMPDAVDKFKIPKATIYRHVTNKRYYKAKGTPIKSVKETDPQYLSVPRQSSKSLFNKQSKFLYIFFSQYFLINL